MTSGRLGFLSVLLLFIWLGTQYASTCTTLMADSPLELLEDTKEKDDKEKDKDDKDKIYDLLMSESCDDLNTIMFNNNIIQRWESPFLNIHVTPPEFS